VSVSQVEAGWLYFDRAWWLSWQVSVDGRTVPVYEALGGQLVSVPPGSHRVVAELTLWEVRLGVLLGGLALAGGTAWVWWGARRRRLSVADEVKDPNALRRVDLLE
jgi:hypothetical protein